MTKFFLTLLLGLSINFSYAQVTGTAALIALDEIDATVTKQLQTIDNLATNAIGNTGNMILSVSSRLRTDINETIGNTDKILRENQLNLYNQLLNLSNDFNDVIKGNLKEVDVITTRLTETIDNFIIPKKEPRIFKYETQSFIKGYAKNYTFKLRGKNFDKSDEVFVYINGKKISPIQVNYNELVFRIDSSDVILFSNDKYYSNAEINFKWRKGLFNKKKETIVPFIIPITPMEIGEATVFYEQALPEKKYTEPISYSCQCTTGSSSWTGSARKSSTAFNIIPTGGKLIDPNSVEVSSWTQRYGGNYSFDHKTEQQIKGEISCKSESQPKGGGGYSSLTFTYREYQIIYPLHKKQTNTLRLTSVNPIVFDLPEPIDGKRPNINYVIIKTYDNKEFVLTPTTLNKYFELKINPVTDDIIVSWKN
ncbi:MAG: hypothetical protein WCY06_09610 [Flavobacteriaceae bacterium]